LESKPEGHWKVNVRMHVLTHYRHRAALPSASQSKHYISVIFTFLVFQKFDFLKMRKNAVRVRLKCTETEGFGTACVSSTNEWQLYCQRV